MRYGFVGMMTFAWVLLAACAAPPSGSSFASQGADAASTSARLATAEPQQSFDALRDAAEAYFAKGAYEQARDAYEKLLALASTSAQRRWCEFRLADTTWRSLASSQRADSQGVERAQEQLVAMVRDVQLEEQQDELWALVHESLGDSYWARRDFSDWGRAWPHYQSALSFWARSSDLERARRRYLDIVFKSTSPSGFDGWKRGHWIHTPDDVLRAAARIAVSVEDRARVHLLRASTLQRRGDIASRTQVAREYEAAIELGRGQQWYDDALYGFGQWLESSGRIERDAQGRWVSQPDYVRAYAIYMRLAEEYEGGESRWRDDALQAAKRIVDVELSVGVQRQFLPGSTAQFQLAWRNVGAVELKLYAFDPIAALEIRYLRETWSEALEEAQLEPVRSWSFSTGDAGLHLRGQQTVDIEGELPLGAYLVVATARGKSARDVLLVTDAALVLQAVGDEALSWAVDARTGAPLAGAECVLWDGIHDSDRTRPVRQAALAGVDGLARWKLRDAAGHGRRVWVFARSGRRLAWAQLDAWSAGQEHEAWRVQVLTDRPTYRPEDTVRYKFVARRYDGERYSTPANTPLRYVIRDSQGGEASKGVVELNEYGTAAGELALSAAMPLGEFSLELRTERDEWIASAPMFQLEEYKLPEFEVEVSAVGERVVRCGERVQARIRAQLYSGGPVPNATLRVVVMQSPHYVSRPVPREFPWFFESYDRFGGWRRFSRSVAFEQTLTTDADGVALLEFDTPADSGNDLEYTIEARVTDASRREVVGSSSVIVGRQGHYAFARATHSVHRVGEPIEFAFETVDANGVPRAMQGEVVVRRLRWFRRWRDPAGRVVGEAAYLAASREKGFDARLWTVVESGHERELVSTHSLATGEDGRATLAFRAEREGCYEAEWTSRDVDGALIQAVASAWVASDDSADLSWRRGDLEIVLDRESLRAGEDAVLLVTSSSGLRHVLLTVESTRLHSSQVLELGGPVKVVKLALDERHVPNVFVRAQAIFDGQWRGDVKELVIPPREQFLSVEVTPPAEDLRPGSTGEWKVAVRDHAGKPARAEVALAIVDESVVAIAGDRDVDPRPFFYGRKRGNQVSTSSSVSERRFAEVERAGPDDTVGERQEWSETRRHAGSKNESDELFLGQGLRDQAAPASQPAVRALAEGASEAKLGAPAGAGGAELTVRSDFRATAYWCADLSTDEAGRATAKVPMPESLTRWRARAHAATRESRFGIGEGRATTSLPLTVRLQAPRFFVAGDVCLVSALVDNHTDEPREVTVQLARDDRGVGAPVEGPALRTVPARGQARFDWRLRFDRAGWTKFTATARSGDLADAMERRLEVFEHGLDQLVALSGKLDAAHAVLSLDVPGPRRPHSTSLVVTLNPNLAVTMLDALPYLIDYPYGCVEQTMSRFLPALVAGKTLADLGLEPSEAMGRVFGGVEGEYASKTHPKGARSLELLDEVTRAGLARIYDFQQSGGGFGWWKGGESDRFMSAYVLWGLVLAREAGADVRWDVAGRTVEHLNGQLIEAEDQPDLAAWMLHALAAFARAERRGPTKFEVEASEKLWAQRDRLNAYTRSLAALAAHDFGQASRAKEWLATVSNGVQIDRTPDRSIVLRGAGASSGLVVPTAHWGRDGVAWRWSEGPVESTATALRALLAIDPEHELVEPVVNWLVRNRRGAQWSSTRDTAMAVLALCGHLRRTGVAPGDVEFALKVNGVTVDVPRSEGLSTLAAPTRIAVDPVLVRDGVNEIEIVRLRGSQPAYFSVEARCFSLEEPLRAAGSELFVRRQYYLLSPRETLLEGVRYDRIPLEQAGPAPSGSRIEVVVTLEAKNDLEYVVIEDLKPAGFEAVDTVSGGGLWASQLRESALAPRLDGRAWTDAERLAGPTQWIHRELRDRKVALFLARLPQGSWEIAYPMRAEVPGEFHALPLVGQAMYAPEIRGNDAEQSVTVE